MTAIALTALPPPAEAAEAADEGEPSPPPPDQALARTFIEGKREVCTDSLAAPYISPVSPRYLPYISQVCTDSLAALAERIKAVRAGGAKAAVRGASAKQAKRGAGKRPKAKAKARPKASGFG